MKRAAIAAGAALLMAVLAGCSTPAPGTQAESAAPLVAESPSPSAASFDEAAFLDDVRQNLPANTQIPNATDEQLLAAGAEACAQSLAGTPSDQVTVIEGEEPNAGGYYLDSGVIMTAASRHLACRD